MKLSSPWLMLIVNGIIKTANYSELITDIYGGEKYPLMAVMDIP